LGDFNVAHTPLDLARPAENAKHAAFGLDMRAAFEKLLGLGLIDLWRQQHPSTLAYSYWDPRMRARRRNVGWRLDYCLVSEDLLPLMGEVSILGQMLGSDHAPISVSLPLSLTT